MRRNTRKVVAIVPSKRQAKERKTRTRNIHRHILQMIFLRVKMSVRKYLQFISTYRQQHPGQKNSGGFYFEKIWYRANHDFTPARLQFSVLKENKRLYVDIFFSVKCPNLVK